MTTDENPHRIVADAAGDGRSDQVQIEYPSAPHKSIRRLEFAHAYSRRGWHMFPCVPRGKKPLTPNGFKDATTDLSQIEKWWAHWPEANIAIATGNISGLYVIDVDGEDGRAAFLNLLQRLHEPLPQTLVCITGRGFHIYLPLPNGKTCPCSTGADEEKGLDVRGDGGYVIAPPSVHESGHLYEWTSVERIVAR